MAARKTRSKKAASKKAAGGALAKRQTKGELALPSDLGDEFGDFATRDKASATQTGGMPWISTQGATPIMRANLGGEMVPVGNADGSLDVVILGGNRGNMYYGTDFQAGVFTPPTCFAVASTDWERGEVEDKLAPPADLATKQDDGCKKCRWNAYGTSTKGSGRGKACNNTVRLMLLPADAKRFDKADGMMLSVPAVSLSEWSTYASRVVDGLGRPMASVVTRIRKVPNERSQGFTFNFEMVRALDGNSEREQLLMLAERVKGDAKQALEQHPPTEASDGTKAGAGGAGKARRRKVTRKKAGRK